MTLLCEITSQNFSGLIIAIVAGTALPQPFSVGNEDHSEGELLKERDDLNTLIPPTE